MERRIVEETPCEHDQVFPHSYMAPHGCHKEYCMEPSHCRGGERRVLTEGQYVLIEKVNGSWPYVLSDEVHRILDALSDHTEGTP